MTDTLRRELPRSPECAAVARQAMSDQFDAVLPADVVNTAHLIVTELATNAYRHGEGRIDLIVTLDGGRLRMEVVDEGAGQAPTIREEPGESGGFGLRIVDRLADRWSAYEGTTHVWAELAIARD